MPSKFCLKVLAMFWKSKAYFVHSTAQKGKQNVKKRLEKQYRRKLPHFYDIPPRAISHLAYQCVAHLATSDKQNIIITVELSLLPMYTKSPIHRTTTTTHDDAEFQLKSCNSKIINVYGLQIAYIFQHT